MHRKWEAGEEKIESKEIQPYRDSCPISQAKSLAPIRTLSQIRQEATTPPPSSINRDSRSRPVL